MRSRALAPIAAFVLLAVFALPAGAVLTGSPSNFESNDGNMVVTTSGNSDWENVDFAHISDTAASTADDSFTPGQKQDTTCPTVEGHKNPPKDDFTDVASFSEVNSTTGDTYLYGATIRYAANGNASENVELKQGTSGLCPGEPDGGLLARTPGDKLIAIDYLNGGTDVQFHVLTWVASGACFVANDPAPCWGATVISLSAAGAEGLASQAAITAANNPISNVALVKGQFAEFGINLATAGIIPSGTCQSFPQTVWESRASGSSFVSSTKDISIENVTISNCGTVIIHKVTDPAGDTTTDFSYTTDVTTDPSTTTSPFTLKDGETNTIENVLPGSDKFVTEADPGPDYALESIDCSASTVPSDNISTDTATGTVTFDIGAGETLECTYTNAKVFGAIQILKDSTKGGAVANDGAVFSISGHDDVTDNGTGDEDSTVGVVCVSGLDLGDHTVNEVSPPDGYSSGTTETDLTATAVAGTDCTDNLPDETGTVTFTNAPLSDIQVNFRDGGSGETSATITCDNTTGTTDDTTVTSGWDTSTTVTDVEAPTTVTCTIVIDP